jgi:hypothetical protein
MALCIRESPEAEIWKGKGHEKDSYLDLSMLLVELDCVRGFLSG